MKGSVKLPVFIDDARKYVNTTQLRAKYLGASYEAEYCQWQTLHGLGSLMETASLIITPNAFLEGKLIASYPPDPIGDFDVVRATTATRVNSAGLVELVPYNLVRYSQEISNTSFWAHYLANLTANTTTAPDGTTTADTIAITGASGSAYQFVTYIGGIHTLSCYFKKINEDNVYMDGNSSSGYYGASFNLTTQAITLFGGGFLPSIESVGNGWYRCSVQADGSGSGSYGFGVYASGGQSAYIWGAQLNEGTIKDYQKTETRLNIPRLDYSNGTCPSLLVEPQRTNIALYSEDIAQTLPTNGGGTITANNTTAPNGVQTADKFTVDTSTGTHYFYNSYAVTNGQSYTTSIFLKKGTGRYFLYRILTNLNSDRFGVTIDLETGTILSTNSIGTPTGTSSKIEDYGNGWYRVSISVNGVGVLLATLLETSNTGTPTLDPFLDYSYTGNGTDTYYLWGMQIEAGSYPTSYIPTTSASVTRNADVISKMGISSLIGQTEGTLFVDAYITGKSTSNGSTLFATDKLSSGAIMTIIYTSSDALFFYVYDGSSFQCSLNGGSFNVGDRVKVACGYKNNDFVMYINGNLIATDTSGSVPATDTANINTSIYADNNGSFINATALWKTRLTNTQLQTLTSI